MRCPMCQAKMETKVRPDGDTFWACTQCRFMSHFQEDLLGGIIEPIREQKPMDDKTRTILERLWL